MTLPLVSVIIPTYNYAFYICEAINSVLQQDYPSRNIEIIVVDDGSTDNTKDALKPFIDKDLIRYYYQENKGKANATKNAILKSNGKYIFNLDADDYFFPDKIVESVKIFESDQDIVHVASPAKFIHQETNESGVEKIPEDLMDKAVDGNWLLDFFYDQNILFGGGTTYSVRASTIKKINIPDAVDMYIDEFLIIAVLPFGKSYFMRQPRSVWRVHNSNYSGSGSSKEKQIKKAERLLRSSEAILKYLNENEFSNKLKKIYRLKDTVLKISFKENTDKKNVGDILKYANEVFFQIHPRWKHIRNYNVLNRLLPTYLYRLLKKILNKKVD